VGNRQFNEQEIQEKRRTNDERKIKALYILLCLIFLLLLTLLGIHAIIVGPGSLFWDFAVNFFAIFSVVAIASGVIFPLLGLLVFCALPFIFFAIYVRNR